MQRNSKQHCRACETCHILLVTKIDTVIIMRLCDIDIGKTACVQSLGGKQSIVRRLRDMGMVEGTPVVPVMVSPLGDPRAYDLRGAVIALHSFRRCRRDNCCCGCNEPREKSDTAFADT